MSVYLNPSSSLGFNRPLTVLVKKTLTITNQNAQPVAFKVKTTAPRQYCVRPNSGRVDPGETIEISVMLQALKEEPPLNAKCKDKFLIQSTLLTPEKEAKPSQDIWAGPEGASEEGKVYQQKLKVVYLPPEGQTLQEEDESGANESSFLLGDSQFDTVKQYNSATNGHPLPQFPESQVLPPREASPPVDFTADFANAHEGLPESLHPEPTPAPPVIASPLVILAEDQGATAPVSVFVQPPDEPVIHSEAPRSLSPTPPSDELLIKFQEAQAEIERLRTLLAAAAPPETELRRRRRDSETETIIPGSDVGTFLEDPSFQQDGVPLQVVVIIALGVFITTYLFF